MNYFFIDEIRELMESVQNSGIPPYLRIYNAIASLIDNGTLADNQRLPADKAMGKMLGVSHITVAKALNRLRRQNLVVRTRSQGTYICSTVKMPRHNVITMRSNLVAVLFDEISAGTTSSDIFTVMHGKLEEAGLKMLFQVCCNRPEQQFRQLRDAMHNPDCCGAIVWNVLDDHHAGLIRKEKIENWPIVFLDEHPERPPYCFDAVLYDTYKASCQMGKEFFAGGGNEVIFLAESWRIHYSSHRMFLCGLHQAAAEYRLDPAGIKVFSYKKESLDIGPLVNRGARSLLMVCSANDAMILTEALERAGRPLDELMPAVSFGVAGMKDQWALPMWLFDSSKMAEEAVEIFLMRLKHGKKKYSDILIQGAKR